jgi:hypothetical protein
VPLNPEAHEPELSPLVIGLREQLSIVVAEHDFGRLKNGAP